jgi:hypothetical protein
VTDFDVTIAFTGALDTANEKNVEGYADVSMSVASDQEIPPEFPTDITVNLRNVDTNTYVRVSELPVVLAMLGPVDMFKNRWIRINMEEVLDAIGIPGVHEKIEEAQQKAEEGAYELTEEQKEQIYAAFKDAEVIKVTQEFKKEKINGTAVYHYAYRIDPEALRAFIVQANEIVPEDPVERRDIDEMMETFEKVDFKGEMWIGAKDYYLYQFTVAPTFEQEEDARDTNEVLVTVSLSKFNEPVTIEVPEDAKPIADIVREAFEARRRIQTATAFLTWPRRNVVQTRTTRIRTGTGIRTALRCLAAITQTAEESFRGPLPNRYFRSLPLNREV